MPTPLQLRPSPRNLSRNPSASQLALRSASLPSSGERWKCTMRICNLYLLLLCLHGLCAFLAGAWQHEGGGIVRQLRMPELVFWQTLAHKDSKAAFDPGGGTARDGADMGHSKSSLEGLGFTQHETGKRELESLSKPIGSQAVMDADAGDQGKSEAAHHTAAGMPNATAEVSSHGGQAAVKRQWPGWLEWLMAERVTWADSVAERLKRRALDAWEDRQLAAFWARNPRPQRHERLKVEVGTVHDAHGSIPDHCAAALHLPKVAFMFLTRGVMYHEAIWDLWFRSAAGLLPVAALSAANCEPGLLEHLGHSCGASAGGGALQQQHLFSVFVHVGANEEAFSGFPEGSLFHGRDISERVHVRWGTFALVEATRALMRAGLDDPLNQKFVLLSEAGIPLYPPDLLYVQLMSEDKSRIDSCAQDGVDRDSHRWIRRMETSDMQHKHWRKSAQWIALGRSHAEIAVGDTQVAAAFGAECRPTWEDGWWRDCYSDEHYFATLLATKGLDAETDCLGQIMHVDWSFGGEHPRSYSAREATSSRLRQLRQPLEGCKYPAALATSWDQFLHIDNLSTEACNAERIPYAASLGYQCPLLARKFSADVAQHMLDLVTSCDSRLNISRLMQC